MSLFHWKKKLTYIALKSSLYSLLIVYAITIRRLDKTGRDLVSLKGGTFHVSTTV